MRVRVVRSILVKHDKLHDFLRLALQTADHVEAQTKIRPDVFWVQHASEEPTDIKVFMDFDSLAQYEELFLEGLLFDNTYLTLAERMADMVKREPKDGLLVLMDKDDYFMNMKDQSKLAPANLARGSVPPRRYRLFRHINVPTGKLRDFMKYAFDFMDQFERVTNFRPELYCTRFTTESIGCSNMFFDFDNCPMCGPILMQQKDLLARTMPELLDGPPLDELYMRVTSSDLAFDLQSAAQGSHP